MREFLLILFLFVFSANYSFCDIADKIVARVNGEIITKYQLDAYAEGNTDKDYVRKCLNSLIDQQLILHNFKANKGKVSESQLESQIDSIIKESFNGNRNTFMKYLESKEQNFKGFQEDLKRSAVINSMLQLERRSIYSLRPNEINTYYNKNLERFKTKAKVLLVQKAFKADSKKNGKPGFDYYNEQLKAGKSVESLADELDELHIDKEWYSEAELNNVLAKYAFTADKNVWSSPILCNDTYFLLNVLDKIPAGVKQLSEVQEEIEEILILEINAKAYDNWLDKLKADASIEIF